MCFEKKSLFENKFCFLELYVPSPFTSLHARTDRVTGQQAGFTTLGLRGFRRERIFSDNFNFSLNLRFCQTPLVISPLICTATRTLTKIATCLDFHYFFSVRFYHFLFLLFCIKIMLQSFQNFQKFWLFWR